MNDARRELFPSSHQTIYQRACSRSTAILREPTGSLAEKWTELEWQAMWYSGAFGSAFRTVAGSVIEIIQFR